MNANDEELWKALKRIMEVSNGTSFFFGPSMTALRSVIKRWRESKVEEYHEPFIY